MTQQRHAMSEYVRLPHANDKQSLTILAESMFCSEHPSDQRWYYCTSTEIDYECSVHYDRKITKDKTSHNLRHSHVIGFHV